jgi:hypothetical protein
MSLTERKTAYSGSIFLERGAFKLETARQDKIVTLRKEKDSFSFINISTPDINKIREWMDGCEFFESDTIGAFLQITSPTALVQMLVKDDEKARRFRLDDAKDIHRFIDVFVTNFQNLGSDEKRAAALNVSHADERIKAVLIEFVNNLTARDVMDSDIRKNMGIGGSAICCLTGGFLFYAIKFHGNEEAGISFFIALALLALGAFMVWRFIKKSIEVKDRSIIQAILKGETIG